MKISEWIRKCQFPLLLALGGYGLSVFAFGYLHNPLLGYAWAPSVVYLLFAWIGLLLPGKWRVLLGVAGTIALLLPPVLLMNGVPRNTVLMVSVPLSALLVWSMRFAGWEREKEMPGGWLIVCFGMLAVAYFCATYEPKLESALAWVRIVMFAFVLLAMLSMNRNSWTLATGNRPGFFPGMRRKNILLILGLFGAALVAALIPSAVNLLRIVAAWVTALMSKLAALFPEETEPAGSSEFMEPGGGEGFLDTMKTHQTSDLMLAVLSAVVIVILIPLTIGAVYMLTKKLWQLFRELYHVVTDGILEEAADYADEITDIREEMEQRWIKGKTTFHRRIKMTPTEKIRYRYLRLVQKNPTWGKHSTARENLTESAAQLYEKARYSTHEITSEDAERFKEETE